eukprot:5223525-Amphidinium_carterae.1
MIRYVWNNLPPEAAERSYAMDGTLEQHKDCFRLTAKVYRVSHVLPVELDAKHITPRYLWDQTRSHMLGELTKYALPTSYIVSPASTIWETLQSEGTPFYIPLRLSWTYCSEEFIMSI